MDPRYTNCLDFDGEISDIPFMYMLAGDSINSFVFGVTDKDCKMITSENYQEYANVQFEISMP